MYVVPRYYTIVKRKNDNNPKGGRQMGWRKEGSGSS